MKNRKGITLFITFLLFCLVIAGCSVSAQQTDISWIEKIDMEQTFPEAPGTLATIYRDISSLAKDAEEIVKISVIGQEVILLDDLPQTHTIVHVDEVIKGKLTYRQEINVIEEGGYEGKVMGGIPQLDEKANYILFLQEYNGNYYICGAFQGRFIEVDGFYFQQATEDVKLKEYKPVGGEEFVSLIKSFE